MVFDGGLEYGWGVGSEACKTCRQYEIRRHFSFRGEGQWQASLNERGFSGVTPRTEAGAEGAYLFVCPSCDQVLRLSTKTPTDSQLYSATLRFADVEVSQMKARAPAENLASAEASSFVEREPTESQSKSFDFGFDQFAPAFCSFTNSPVSGEPVKATFSILERIRKENLKLRRQYRSRDGKSEITNELWFESGAWFFVVINADEKLYDLNHRFIWCQSAQLLVVQLERFVSYSYIEEPSAAHWTSLKSYLVSKDTFDVSQKHAWVSRRLDKARARMSNQGAAHE